MHPSVTTCTSLNSICGIPRARAAIYDHICGNLNAVRALLRRKRRAIEWHRTRTYIEASNVFLKSYWDLALEFFPGTTLFHLIHNPLEVARSAVNREMYLCEGYCTPPSTSRHEGHSPMLGWGGIN